MVTRSSVQSVARQLAHRTSPWMALPCAGSDRGARIPVPSHSYAPPARRFGHGTSTWPRPPPAISHSPNPSSTGTPSWVSVRSPPPT